MPAMFWPGLVFFIFLQAGWVPRNPAVYILGFTNLLGAGFTAYLLYKSKATDIIDKELNVYKDRSDRLDKELEGKKGELTQAQAQIAGLLAKTDLSPLIQLMTESVKDTREFEKSTSSANQSLVQLWTKHTEDDVRNNERLVASMESISKTMQECREEIRLDKEQTVKAFAHVTDVLSTMLSMSKSGSGGTA